MAKTTRALATRIRNQISFLIQIVYQTMMAQPIETILLETLSTMEVADQR